MDKGNRQKNNPLCMDYFYQCGCVRYSNDFMVRVIRVVIREIAIGTATEANRKCFNYCHLIISLLLALNVPSPMC